MAPEIILKKNERVVLHLLREIFKVRTDFGTKILWKDFSQKVIETKEFKISSEQDLKATLEKFKAYNLIAYSIYDPSAHMEVRASDKYTAIIYPPDRSRMVLKALVTYIGDSYLETSKLSFKLRRLIPKVTKYLLGKILP